MIEAFKISYLPKKRKLKNFVSRCLKQIKDRQLKDGSFGLWENSPTNFFVTGTFAYYNSIIGCVAMAVGLCKEKGYSIPGMLVFNWMSK